jgi:SNF2 family DNA or RNA helicase
MSVIESLRKAKRANLKPCSYIKETTYLRDYQTVGVAHLISLNRMILGDGVGLGKTIQIICAYAYRLLYEPELKLLVVTPKSAMEQWKEEIEKFCNNISVHILTNKISTAIFNNDNKVKNKILRSFEARALQYKEIKSNVIICNYRTIQEDYNFIIENRLPLYMVVFDEVQEIKNYKTKTWFAANMIASRAKYVYGVSATIIKNRLEEAYNIYRVIVPGLFPGKIKFYEEYIIKKKMSIWRQGRKRYFNKIVGYKNLNKFKEIITPYFLMRKTQDVAKELPKLISRKLILEMTSIQEQLYKKALSGQLYREIIKDKFFKFQEYLSTLLVYSDKDQEKYENLKRKYEESLTKEGLIKNKIAALSYCQLVSNGPGWINEEGESSKETEFKRLFEQELIDEKTIVFTRFKSGIKRLENILNELSIKYVKITGDEDIKDREKAKKLFQDLDNEYKVIFITQAGSAAINLQAAGVILYYDTPWSYGDLYQSIGRAQRIGSLKEHILLLHMINKNTIDEHVIKILESKKELINEIMGDIAIGAIEFDKNDIIFKDNESSIDELFNNVFGVKSYE